MKKYAHFGSLFGGHEHHSSGTIVQTGRVGGGDSAALLLECGLETGNLVKLDLGILLILGDLINALAGFDLDRDALLGHGTALPGLCSALVLPRERFIFERHIK